MVRAPSMARSTPSRVEAQALPVVRIDVAGDELEALQDADGSLWVGARAAAAFLGYASKRVFLLRIDAQDVREEIAPYLVSFRLTTAGGSPQWLIREAGLLILAQRMRGERGRIARRKLAEFREADAQRARVRAQAGPFDALRSVLEDARAGAEAIGEGAGRKEKLAREVASEVVALLDEARQVVEVADEGVAAVAQRSRMRLPLDSERGGR